MNTLIKSSKWVTECCYTGAKGKILKFKPSDWDGYCVCEECEKKVIISRHVRLHTKCPCGSHLAAYCFKDNDFVVFCISETCYLKAPEIEGKTLKEALDNYISLTNPLKRKK